ncbi:alpha/beta fold hydrolase [Erwinia sp. AnSW2-5]|uniref:alpha/beta fold hydrolase n=1 Tax=Erwinia sp. AnSW2-5 TaxID=3367692 RepID=UPI00385FC374
MKMPLVLLPGLMCDAGLWQRMRPELENIGPLTFGDLSQGSTVEEMADAVLVNCPPQFTLVGFSMGGFVARAIARRVPQRVQRLILIATSSEADDPMQAELKAAVAEMLQRTRGPFRGLGQRAIELSLSREHESDPQLKQQILDMSLRLGRDTYIRQLLMARDSDSARLNAIRCPTLVVAAADDRMRTLTESQALAEAIPGASLAILHDSGHMLPLEQPGPLAACLRDWLSANVSLR